jgi:hypothetical protein
MRTRADLRPEQLTIYNEIVNNDARLIVSAMGSGKSGATLTALKDMLDSFDIQHVLIIAPKFVARNTWPDEIAAWAHTQNLSYAICVGTEAERIAALKKNAEITIINKDVLPWLAKHIETVKNWRWDCLVIDESSMFKAGKKRTTRTRVKGKDGSVRVRKGGNMTRFGVLSTARKMIKKVVLLTGTPAPNGIEDLWGQIYLLDQGQRLGRSLTAFHDRWFDKNKYTHQITPKPGAEDEIKQSVKDVMISIPVRQLVADPVFIPVKVPLPAKAMRDYREFERTLFSEPYDVEAVSKGVLTNKLMQFCIAKNTLVLTDQGWWPIQTITSKMKVWDGVEWVNHKGLSHQGVRSVISAYGVKMTPDHKVLTEFGWQEASEVEDGKSTNRPNRQDVRLPHGNKERGYNPRKEQKSDMALPVRLWKRGSSYQSEFAIETPTKRHAFLWLQTWLSGFGRSKRSYDDWHSSLGNLAAVEKSLPKPKGQGLQALRRSGNLDARRVVRFLRGVLERHAGGVRGPSDLGTQRCERELFGSELSLGHLGRAGDQQAEHGLRGNREIWSDAARGTEQGDGPEVHYPDEAFREGLLGRHVACASREHHQGACETYDLIDCGPRNRFVVKGSDGPLIVHNCNGHLYKEDRSAVQVHTAKFDALDELIERAAGDPVLIFYSFKFDLIEMKKRHPDLVVANECDDFVSLWNEGKIRKLAAHPASIGHGVNLQYGGHIAIWFGLTFSLELYLQANARLPRPGQKNIVAIYQIIAEGTYDETALEILQRKDVTQQAIVESVLHRLST